MSRAKRPVNRHPVEPSTPTDEQAPATKSDDDKPQAPWGFARVPKETLRQWASLGGKVAQHNRSAHRFTSETARAAGKRGGEAIAKDREHMRELGRRGGAARANARKAAQATQTEMPADTDHTDEPSE